MKTAPRKRGSVTRDAIADGSTPLPDGWAEAERHFEHWAAAGSAKGKPYSALTITKYRQIWLPWLKYLAGKGIAWDEAKRVHLSRYLKSLGHSFKGRSSTSEVTVRRYWAVLGDLYGVAVAEGRIAVNPASGPHPAGPNTIKTSMVIHPFYLEKLRAELPPLDPDDWKSSRDRALLAVLMNAGPTSREVRTLQLRDIVRRTTHEHLVLRIQTGGRSQDVREIPLDEWASDLLDGWLKVRQRLEPEPDTDVVFVSKRGRKPLEDTDVLKVVTLWFKVALEKVGMARVDHMGANALRTAAIIWWRDRCGHDTATLLRLSGISQLQSLRRLPPRDGEAKEVKTKRRNRSGKVAAKGA